MGNMPKLSKRLIGAYVLDWIVMMYVPLPNIPFIFFNTSLTINQLHCCHRRWYQLCRAVQAAFLPAGLEHLLPCG